MKEQPEVRYFPIPKNLKEMTSDEKKEYATQLVDHMLKQGNEVTKKLEISRRTKIVKTCLQIFVAFTALFFYLISILQFKDHFATYGFVSIGIGSSFLGLAFLLQVVLKKRKV